MRPFFKRIILGWIIFGALNARAEIVLPDLISDGMVIQQDMPVHIWGRGAAGEKVQVSILNQTKTTVTGADGKWQLWLDPLKSKTVTTMTVAGINRLTINNILVGEVWLASGQSNMEWDVSQSNNATNEIASANYPEIRIFDAARSFSDTVKTDIKGKWVVCSPATIKNITAAGYFFARGIYKQLKVPVGLIEASWGATRCEAWTPAAAQQADPRLSYWHGKWDNYLRTLPAQKEAYERKLAEWKKESEEAKASGKAVPSAPEEPKAVTKAKPSAIYNAVVAPLTNYSIKGVIWYQGENNAYKDEAFSYRYLFPVMIESWRAAWKQGDFPFIFVQLSTLNKHPYWPVLRESQTEALKLKNTAMVVSYDVGDSTNAHYKNKQAVGQRLELAARRLVYGENITASGPLFRQMTFEGNGIRVWFDHGKGLKPSSGTTITGFEIAGEDGKLVPAKASNEGETILVSSTQVAKPAIVRYAFKDAVVANLVNSAGLPAIPFRTNVKDGL